MTVKGKFGPIAVRDQGGIRKLFLNDQLQGGSFLNPSASVVDAGLSGPGPVSSSPYSYGWLLAGISNPTGSGIMIGLGSGAGATQFLYSFPEADLTVVEIDPKMVDVACSNYPLLDYYCNTGRLAIVVQDAESYLAEEEDVWDFSLSDAYTGGKRGDISFLPGLCRRSENVYLNFIGHLGDQEMLRTLEELRTLKHAPTEVYKATYPQYVKDFSGLSNWIITDALVPETVETFKPFPKLSGKNVEFGRELWNLMLRSSVTSVLS